MRVVFELEEVPGGIFEKECVMLDPGAREPNTGLLIERQLFRLGLFQKPLPRIFRQKSQTKMVGINALLLWQMLRRQMGYKLMPRKSERDGVARLSTQRTAKPLDIKALRCRHIVYGKSQVKKRILHGNCPRTFG
jgi:hypothetical protein